VVLEGEPLEGFQSVSWRVTEHLGVAASSEVLRIGRAERSLKQSLQVICRFNLQIAAQATLEMSASTPFQNVRLAMMR
jgi:hypothetical protein